MVMVCDTLHAELTNLFDEPVATSQPVTIFTRKIIDSKFMRWTRLSSPATPIPRMIYTPRSSVTTVFMSAKGLVITENYIMYINRVVGHC